RGQGHDVIRPGPEISQRLETGERTMRIAAALFSALLLAGCASSNAVDAPRTVGDVDLQRYQGTWYEQARLPMFFQRDCVRSEARYRLQDQGRVEVVNRCETASGEWKEAR